MQDQGTVGVEAMQALRIGVCFFPSLFRVPYLCLSLLIFGELETDPYFFRIDADMCFSQIVVIRRPRVLRWCFRWNGCLHRDGSCSVLSSGLLGIFLQWDLCAPYHTRGMAFALIM